MAAEGTARELLLARYSAAVSAVESALRGEAEFSLVEPTQALPPLRRCSKVWLTTVRNGDTAWSVEIGLPKYFPDEPPIACAKDGEALYLQNPHIQEGGVLCTIPDSAALNRREPLELVKYVLEQCRQILSGTGRDDFREEFSSYWIRKCPEDSPPVLIIDPIEKMGESFESILNEKAIIISSSRDRLDRWISNFTKTPLAATATIPGVTLRLSQPLLPAEYPETVDDLIKLAESISLGLGLRIKTLLSKSTDRFLALLVQNEGDGLALGGIVFEGLGLANIRSVKLTHGFPPSQVPPDILYARSLDVAGSGRVVRSRVTRVDHQWVHSRGGDGRDLSKFSVLVIGCGSLGGYVAHLLARAGVGRMTLIDSEQMRWENLGRHVLGASAVGRSKAEALTSELAQQLPHLSFSAVSQDWRDAITKDSKLLTDNHIVVSTAADWRCEGPLNDLARQKGIPPIVLGWLEPHAVAGHSLLLTGEGGCFQCGSNGFGRFVDAVSHFESDPLSREPGSCTHYQRYGPTALMPIAAMVATTVIDALLSAPKQASLATWVGGEDHFTEVGATLSGTWASGGQEVHLRIHKRPWPKNPKCPVCIGDSGNGI